MSTCPGAGSGSGTSRSSAFVFHSKNCNAFTGSLFAYAYRWPRVPGHPAGQPARFGLRRCREGRVGRHAHARRTDAAPEAVDSSRTSPSRTALATTRHADADAVAVPAASTARRCAQTRSGRAGRRCRSPRRRGVRAARTAPAGPPTPSDARTTGTRSAARVPLPRSPIMTLRGQPAPMRPTTRGGETVDLARFLAPSASTYGYRRLVAGPEHGRP